MRKWFAAVAVAAFLVGCGKTAEVRCAGAVGGISCSVQNTSQVVAAEVCWRVSLTCSNGERPWATTCQRVEAGSTAARLVEQRDVWGFDKCDRPVGMTVDQVTVK